MMSVVSAKMLHLQLLQHATNDLVGRCYATGQDGPLKVLFLFRMKASDTLGKEDFRFFSCK